MNVDDVVFRVRALAQAHPLTTVAERYVADVVARERARQPHPELGVWAGNALTVGYALRTFEEVEVLGERRPSVVTSVEVLDAAARRIAAAIRTDGAGCHLWEEATVVGLLDRLIAGEIDRRLDQWKETVDPEVWRDMVGYLAWWTVAGYALRVAETSEEDPRG